MEDKKYKLVLIGITYNQIESGVYALILQQEGGTRRIPIIIGFPEAQAIECKLQEIKTPRPLTHDLIVNTLNELNIELKYILIKRLPNGVFAADLHFFNGWEEKIIDARSSDAIALAIRMDAPIYTTEEVLREAGFDPTETKKSVTSGVRINPVEVEKPSPAPPVVGIENMTIEQLSAAMETAAKNEDYEEAARIKTEINKRKNPES